MKKLFLLATAALVGFGANAQYAAPMSGGLKTPVVKHHVNNFQTGTVLGKSTAGGSRWYDHQATVDLYNGGVMSGSYMPIWFDSTVMQVFTSGLGNINYSSLGQIIDPIYYTLFNDPNVYSPNDIRINTWDAYEVDSISLQGIWLRNANKPTSIVDTMILSVSPSTYSYYYDFNTQADPDDDWVDAYVPAPGDTIRGFTILDVDSVNRASLNAGVVMWKVPITDDMRQPDDDTVEVQSLDVQLPTPCQIPAGRGIAITATFKSGEAVPVPNVDTFWEYHHFYALEGEALGAGQIMPYYYYSHADRNMSNLMFSTDTTRYIPSVFIEGWNTIAFRQEFHSIQAHVVCANCTTLGVNDTKKSNVSQVGVYPNPANNEVNIGFTVGTASKATITITNAVGQVMNTLAVDAKAGVNNLNTFSTAGMAAGVYFFTIEANGSRATERFVVSH